MSKICIGSRWHKFDFHTHTPASSDYLSKDDTHEEWLKACMDKEVDCVAVTDHVSGDWIDELQQAYRSLDTTIEWYRPLYIFPGVEITVSIGTGRVHVLAIFDPSANAAKITGILGQCGITEGHGDVQNTYSSQSVENVIDIVQRANGVLIPAHIDGQKGLLHEVSNTNAEIKGWMEKITAAEFIDHHYLDGVNEELRADAVNLAKISGSDAHKLEDIGCRFTWVKMGEPSISGLRLALHDGSFCIDNETNNPNTCPNIYIDSLEVTNMAHCGRRPGEPAVFKLHPLFNAVIGGRGSGKSTFIEALRMSMGRVLELKELPIIKREVDSFIHGVALDDTVITANLNRRDEQYRCRWKHASHNEIEKYDDGEWVADHGSPGERFHISIYSQKQINALSSNPNSLLEIIDRSADVDKATWQRRYDTEVESFVTASQEVRQLKVKISNQSAIQAQLDDVNSDISSFEKGGHGNLFSNYQLNSATQAKLDATGNVESLKEKLEAVSTFRLAALDLSNLGNESDPSAESHELAGIHNQFEQEISQIREVSKDLVNNLESVVSDRLTKIEATNWANERNTVTQQYEAVAAEYREKGEELDPDDYEKWLELRNSLSAQLEEIEQDRIALEEKKKQRTAIHRKLFVLHRRLQKKRSQFIERVLGNNKYVRMTLIPFADLLSLEKQYRNHIGIENTFSSSILQDGSEQGLLSHLIKPSHDLKARVKATSALKKATRQLAEDIDVNGLNVDGRLKSTLGQRLSAQPENFDRLDAWWPDDKLVVEYARDPETGVFANIEKGSAGQKAAAILAFLLSHGDNPIIVDQPEDDLDNALIYQLIVSQIHQNKKRRQIIVVTHNPNIVVNGDSELINVLEFRGGQVQVLDCGGLSEQSIRTHICEIMEGGVEAFEKRYRRIAMA